MLVALVIPRAAGQAQEVVGPKAPAQESGGLLKLLGITPSAESVDYVMNKTQFQLHTLLTEQRHPKTWNLGERIRKDTLAGLRMLSSVDEDVQAKLEVLAGRTEDLDRMAAAVADAVRGKRRIYVYGCGATGRLAKQMESSFWRPFWRKVKADGKVWSRLEGKISATIEDDLVGEMTGGDRALISSLEGFEDLQLIGKLQLWDHDIKKGDVVICVTEGGETSSVIGTILAAHRQWLAAPGYSATVSRGSLFFVYNNPDERLMPFLRSRAVLQEPGITKVNLTTGPQAITGSTRMQATTIETFVVATAIEAGLDAALRPFLPSKEMEKLGFGRGIRIGEKLREFAPVLKAVQDALPGIARWTDLETRTYETGHFSTYFAERGLITVFIDSTERSPTFRLYPLDTVNEPVRKCWIQVWTGAKTQGEAWRAFLGRPFRGLEPGHYQAPFEREVEDPYLRQAALASLKKAGNDQQDLYDFSSSDENAKARVPMPGDLGVIVALSPEEAEMTRAGSAFCDFKNLCAKQGAALAVLLVTDGGAADAEKAAKAIVTSFESAKDSPVVVPVSVRADEDPFGLRQQIAAKMILNAHSTAVMAKLGKVVGNTMTNVSPSNLKLIGRATFLIQSHVNDAAGRPGWVKANGKRAPITYGEANAVLYDSIAFLKDKQREAGQTAEVALSIIRILESIKERRGVTPDEALAIVRSVGLSAYLSSIT